MDRICENEIRLVEMKGDSLIVKLKNCGECEGCKPRKIVLVDLAESDDEMDYQFSPLTRYLNGRFVHINEIIQLD